MAGGKEGCPEFAGQQWCQRVGWDGGHPRLPAALRKCMTADRVRGRLYRGSEMACHPELTRRLKNDIWFCDPHARRPRGSNENTNGLRRYD